MATLHLILGAGWANTLKDSSLVRLSKTVYLKSSLVEWEALTSLASNCVNSGYGRLVLLEVLDANRLKKNMKLLSQSDLTVNDVMEKAEELEDFLFLLRLELYSSNRPNVTRIKLNPNCTQRETSALDSEQRSLVINRLNHFESILRDRVGIDANLNIQTPLRRRRIELISSLRDAMKGQFPNQWLLPKK